MPVSWDFRAACRSRSLLSWCCHYSWVCYRAWCPGAWYCCGIAPWTLPLFAGSTLMLFSRGRGPIFAWVCRACRRCSTRRRSRNCWRFWACRCIWRCMGSFVEWRGCWSRWPCTIPAWVFLWTFMPGPLWWRLPASRPGALPCRPWRRRPRLVATSVRSFRLSSPSVILYSTILIRHREEFRIYEKDRLEKKDTDWKKDMGKGWTGECCGFIDFLIDINDYRKV